MVWLVNAGQYKKAEPLAKKTLEQAERVLGKEYPDTLMSVNNLGFLYSAQGRYGEAEPLLGGSALMGNKEI